MKQVEELKVRFSGAIALPDPAKIDSTGDWYYLSHVSSGLVSFDSEKKKFIPLMLEKLPTADQGLHRFKLLSDLKFHDGTPITIKDVIWSIKRQLILKSSTHFHLWEYVVGCENLKTLDEDCVGLRMVSDREFEIHLKIQADSFFLQLASPETGIWSAQDMDPKNGALRATKFSGPYYVDQIAEDAAYLTRNEYSQVSRHFPASPRAIRLMKVPLPLVNQALKDRKIDLTVRSYRPFGEENWSDKKIGVRSTTPSTIIYLYGTGFKSRKPVGRNLLKAAWELNQDQGIIPADTFLPFAQNYGLRREDFLMELPEKTEPVLRVLCPENFFSELFLEQLQRAAQRVGSEIKFYFVPAGDWFAAFEDEKSAEKYDYILSSYAASERYPSVQLRHITGNLPKPPIDLMKAESPDLNADRIAVLKNYQRWLLRSHQAIPIYFNSTLFLYQDHLDLGAQPTSDAEIELWRVTEKGQP